jgi:GNAT superfamily N-acetyltransferase
MLDMLEHGGLVLRRPDLVDRCFQQNGRMYSVRPLPTPTPGELEALAGIFDAYRSHYGEETEPGRSASWLAHQLQTARLNSFVADDGSAIIGFATSIEVPATLRLGHWWQIRDVFVLPEHRRRGIAVALLDAIRAAADASGALRLGLQTEDGNDAALALYRRAGYVAATGYLNLTLPLRPQ